MDARGTAECIEYCRSTIPRDVQSAVLTEDGDAKKRLWELNDWTIAKCVCHKAKNLPKSLKKNMSGIPCTCSGVGGKKCQNIPGNRFQDRMAQVAGARFHQIVKQAVARYQPERVNNKMFMPLDVGSAEREVARQEAVTWAQGQILAMSKHFVGDHSMCTHEALPPHHPTLKCKDQITYMNGLLKSLAGCMGEILSPFGALDINSTESCHAVLRLYREKGRQWSFVPCFLGEVFGFLHWQRLELAFWGTIRNPVLEFAAKVMAELGVEMPILESEVKEMDDRLERAVNEKEARSDPEFKNRRRIYRAKKGNYAATSSSSSSYQSGGSLGAFVADSEASVEIDFLGAGAVELELPEDESEDDYKEDNPGDFDASEPEGVNE
jgi:hypothetical protein